MGMKNAKQEVREVLDLLPDDCTLEDIEYALHVREEIREGLRSLENEPVYTQEEVEAELADWLID
jgi:predicted transcriptional regulator